MSKYSDDFYRAAIKNAFPDAADIRVPIVVGRVAPVFLADVLKRTIVCKFNPAPVIFRNHVVSNLLCDYMVPVPRTDVHAYIGTWFESYDYCHDRTLFECISDGMKPEKVFNAYCQAINWQKRISFIPESEFNPEFGRYASSVFAATQKGRVHPAVAYVYALVHRIFSDNNATFILHNDIQPRNILVDSNGDFSKFIDLDSVSLCNESFSVMLTLRLYPLQNYSEYMDYYEDTMHRKINRRAIMYGLDFLRRIRRPQIALNRMLWRGYNPPPER